MSVETLSTDPAPKSSCEPTLWWTTRKLADVPQDDDWLGPGEVERLSGLRLPKRRNDWRLGRWTAKLAVRSSGLVAPDIPFSQIEILACPDGAPEVWVAGRVAACAISLSHSFDVGFCVVTRQSMALGCDLERIEARDALMISDHFTVAEAAAVAQAPAGDRDRVANLIWSAKESALKALRAGMRRDTRSVVVGVDPVCGRNSWNPLVVTCQESGRKFHGWWSVEEGFMRTIATDRPTRPPQQRIFGGGYTPTDAD